MSAYFVTLIEQITYYLHKGTASRDFEHAVFSLILSAKNTAGRKSRDSVPLR
jgi:hypothetical protein